MPKSNIYENTRPSRVLQDDGTWVEEPPAQPRRVSVGWAKGTHVQVGIGWVDPKALDEVGRHAGWAADYITSGETDELGKVWLSQWCDMDRHTINQLIRDLRKARDEAFGRDE